MEYTVAEAFGTSVVQTGCVGDREIMSEQLQFERDLYLGYLQQLGASLTCDIWVKNREGRYLLVN